MKNIVFLICSFIIFASCGGRIDKDKQTANEFNKLQEKFKTGSVPAHTSLLTGSRKGKCYAGQKDKEPQQMDLVLEIRIRNQFSKDYSARYHIILTQDEFSKAQRDGVFKKTDYPIVNGERLVIATNAYADGIVRFDIAQDFDEIIVKIFEVEEQGMISTSYMCRFSI